MEGQAPAVLGGPCRRRQGKKEDGGAPCELERLMHGAERGKIRSRKRARDYLSLFNPIQYEVIRMLALPENNLFAVGDDDQSIYRFRGSEPDIMLSFERQYPGAKRVVLAQNYRSAGNITEAAGRVIRKNLKRFDKEFLPVREPGKQVCVRAFEDKTKEAEALAEFARAYKRAGGSYGDIAILYRTGTSAQPFVRAFWEGGVPFSVGEEAPNLYEHFIAKDLFAYLRLAIDGPARAPLLRILNKPMRYLSRKSLEEKEATWEGMMEFYRDKSYLAARIERLRQDLERLKNMRPGDAVCYIRDQIGYGGYLREYASYRHLDAEPLMEILTELKRAAGGCGSLEEWMDKAEAYGRFLSEQKERRGCREEREKEIELDRVGLMTMHSSKGLEFPVVFIVDANEGCCPHSRAVLPEEIEEERRIFYVAMTRAKDRLYIGYVLKENGREKRVSRFVEEMGSR